MSISRIFDISRQALLTHRSAIDITARNIANVNTEGYKRRRIDLSKLALGLGGLNGMLTKDGVTRIHQRFVENQLWYEDQDLGKYQSDEMILTQVQGIFNEPTASGLSNVLSEFWNVWNDLANDPESQSTRSLVRDKGVILANTFNRNYQSLRDLQYQIGLDIQENVSRVNQVIGQIKTINEKVGVHLSNDLLDQRDLLINDLSKLINIDIKEYSSGEVTISSRGQILVSGNYINELVVDISMENGLRNIDIKFNDGRSVNILSGQLGSLIEVHNRHIPDYIEKLNLLATSIATQVNSIHTSGYNVSGVTGIDFFSSDITGAADFKIDDNVYQNPSLIATSTAIDEPGDGSIAQLISDIQFEKNIQGGTVSEFYHSLISQIGSQVQEATFLRESQEIVVQTLRNQQDSISGVSLDEEMTRLIEFEQAFEAAARMITVVDEMIDTVLNMV